MISERLADVIRITCSKDIPDVLSSLYFVRP